MADDRESFDPPQDTGPPDAVETDPAALNSAEDLDEDRLRVDPLEAGMDPPERWSGADKYGTTANEQRTARPLDDRLAEEQADVQPETGSLASAGTGAPAPPTTLDPDSRMDERVAREARDRGQEDDETPSMASVQRTPPPPG